MPSAVHVRTPGAGQRRPQELARGLRRELDFARAYSPDGEVRSTQALEPAPRDRLGGDVARGRAAARARDADPGPTADRDIGRPLAAGILPQRADLRSKCGEERSPRGAARRVTDAVERSRDRVCACGPVEPSRPHPSEVDGREERAPPPLGVEVRGGRRLLEWRLSVDGGPRRAGGCGLARSGSRGGRAA